MNLKMSKNKDSSDFLVFGRWLQKKTGLRVLGVQNFFSGKNIPLLLLLRGKGTAENL